jgi:hypothetical protein
MILGMAVACPASANVTSFLMKGKVTAVDVPHHTVVIEVPMVEKRFTVGGPLSRDAVLTRKGHPAKLGDFRAGDPVSVVWHAAPEGHVIDKLEMP